MERTTGSEAPNGKSTSTSSTNNENAASSSYPAFSRSTQQYHSDHIILSGRSTRNGESDDRFGEEDPDRKKKEGLSPSSSYETTKSTNSYIEPFPVIRYYPRWHGYAPNLVATRVYPHQSPGLDRQRQTSLQGHPYGSSQNSRYALSYHFRPPENLDDHASHGSVSETSVRKPEDWVPWYRLPERTLRNPREYINPDILQLAEQMNLPADGEKFSPEHWKAILTLMYRWKATSDEVEQKLAGNSTSTSHSNLAYCSHKSVKSFCDKVLCRPGKRRQFSIYWRKSGLKHFVQKYEDEGRDLPSYQDQRVQTLFNVSFTNRAKKNSYTIAKEKVLVERQEQIHEVWTKMTQRGTNPTMQDLATLQDLIERPVCKTVEIMENGCKTSHKVTIDGFDGRHSEDDTFSTRSEAEKNIWKPSPKQMKWASSSNSGIESDFLRSSSSTRVHDLQETRSGMMNSNKMTGLDKENEPTICHNTDI